MVRFPGAYKQLRVCVYHGLRLMVSCTSIARRHHRGPVVMERCCALHHCWVRRAPGQPMIEAG